MSDISKIVIFQGFIPPYRLPLFSELSKQIPDIQFIVASPMEFNRQWPANFGKLNVIVQRSISVRMWWRTQDFKELMPVNLPIDSLKLLFRLRPQVIVCPHFGAQTCWAALYKILRPRTRLIIWATASEKTEAGRGWFRTTLRRIMVACADAAVVNGKSGQNYVRTLGMADERMWTVPYTIDHSAFRRSDGPTSRRTAAHSLLYVGQLIPRKGLDRFLRVLSDFLLQRPGTECLFEIAGTGPQRKELEKIPTPRNLSVRFLDGLGYDQLPAVYARAGIFVFPTMADEWGVVVNEALASGLPVLGSVYSQAVEELIRDGVNGWKFRPDDDADVIRALSKVFSLTPDEVETMRAQCRESIEAITPAATAAKISLAITNSSTAPSRQSEATRSRLSQ
jgi:glycosyltransferase involved in cell wall biosynthesis